MDTSKRANLAFGRELKNTMQFEPLEPRQKAALLRADLLTFNFRTAQHACMCGNTGLRNFLGSLPMCAT